jgi:hypothetical protein
MIKATVSVITETITAHPDRTGEASRSIIKNNCTAASLIDEIRLTACTCIVRKGVLITLPTSSSSHPASALRAVIDLELHVCTGVMTKHPAGSAMASEFHASPGTVQVKVLSSM